jgi:hypothetical protein
MTAAGFLTLPPTAHADPGCTQYGVVGDFGLRQSNGYAVAWYGSNAIQQSFTGDQATTTSVSGGAVLDRGTIYGGVQGGHVDFTIHWDSGLRGHYAGDVGDDGFAHGRTNDEANPGSTANWDSTSPFQCATPVVAPPALPPPAQPADVQRVATVTNDVDVYNIAHDDIPDANGVQGAKIGVLRAGQQVRLEGPCLPTGWCHIRTSEVNGFVLGNLQF